MALSVEHLATMVNGTKDPLQWFNNAYRWAVSAHWLARKFSITGSAIPRRNGNQDSKVSGENETL
jgi:hypothetical protein